MKRQKRLIVSSILISIFVIIVSISSWYVQLIIETGEFCSCFIPLPILIPILASVGLLTGTLIYYIFFSDAREKAVNIEPLLKLVSDTEREIIKFVLDNEGEVSQAKIVSFTGIPKVKVFRALEKLRKNGLIEKEKKGKINKIFLSKDIMEIFR